MKQTMPRPIYLALAVLLCVALAPSVSAEKPKLLKRGDSVEEGQPVRVVGKIVSREEKDKDGNPITRAFLEQEGGDLIELPCEKKDEDGGLAKKAVGNALGKDSCFEFVGQKVEILGEAQRVTKKGKRWLRLGRLTGISPL